VFRSAGGRLQRIGRTTFLVGQDSSHGLAITSAMAPSSQRPNLLYERYSASQLRSVTASSRASRPSAVVQRSTAVQSFGLMKLAFQCRVRRRACPYPSTNEPTATSSRHPLYGRGCRNRVRVESAVDSKPLAGGCRRSCDRISRLQAMCAVEPVGDRRANARSTS
jgi:hypothetical protein